MQKLHLVGITPELDGLILSARRGAKTGSFVVSVDAATLQKLTEGAKPKGGRSNGTVPGHAPRTSSPQSELTPREMQELLRAGWTVEEVADEAGVDVDWVSRFASPVLAELRRVVDAARELVFAKPRFGPSALALAASVRRNVAERGLRFTDEEFDDGWRAHQLDDVQWVVAFEYTSRGRAQRAEWVLDLEEGELGSNNRLGSQLGYVQSARRRVGTAAPAKPKPAGAKKAAAKKAAAKPRSRQSASKAPAKKAAARKKRSTKPDAVPDPAPTPPNPQHDPYREELRRRLADPAAAPRPPAPPPPPPPPPPPARAREAEHRPVPIIGPTVRSLTRRLPPRREPPPPPRRQPAPKPGPPEPDTGPTPAVARDDDLPDLSWSPAPTRGPMPPPEPIPVPDEIKEKVASPLGRVEDDDLPAETWFPKGPTFKGAQQGSAAAARRRRTEPLRGR